MDSNEGDPSESEKESEGRVKLAAKSIKEYGEGASIRSQGGGRSMG